MGFIDRLFRPPRARTKPRRWRDVGRAEKYALIHSHVFFWALIAGATYLFATRIGIAVALVYLVPVLVFLAWVLARIRRGGRSDD